MELGGAERVGILYVHKGMAFGNYNSISEILSPSPLCIICYPGSSIGEIPAYSNESLAEYFFGCVDVFSVLLLLLRAYGASGARNSFLYTKHQMHCIVNADSFFNEGIKLNLRTIDLENRFM